MVEEVKDQLSYYRSAVSVKRFVSLPRSLNAACSFQTLYKYNAQVLEADHSSGYS